MVTFVAVALFDKDLQTHFPVRHGVKSIFYLHQPSGNQSKEIARLGEWIVKGRKVAAVVQHT